MSRLDSFIRRMQAQRACLDNAIGLIRALPGNVLEFGLGNGRTYDHLRERLPTRDIFVFDRQLAAYPDCIPPADRLFFGEVLETLPQAIVRLGANTALANLDIGSGDEQATEELVRHITPLLLRLLKPGAIIVSGRPIEHSSLTALSLPYAVKPGRQFMYSRTSDENFAALVDLKHVNDNRLEKMTIGWKNTNASWRVSEALAVGQLRLAPTSLQDKDMPDGLGRISLDLASDWLLGAKSRLPN